MSQRQSPRQQSRHHLLVSGYRTAEKAELNNKIQTLGGQLLQGDHFRPECTHIVCKKPTRGEKYLAGCLTGCWLLTPAYIDDSYRSGRWLQEEGYEWSPDKRHLVPDPALHFLLNAPRKWRQHLGAGGALPFAGWAVAILVEEGQRKATYKRLLELGGATTQDLTVPIRSPVKVAALLTHVFVDDKMSGAAEPLRRHGVLCVHPVYIGDYLMETSVPVSKHPAGASQSPPNSSQSKQQQQKPTGSTSASSTPSCSPLTGLTANTRSSKRITRSSAINPTNMPIVNARSPRTADAKTVSPGGLPRVNQRSRSRSRSNTPKPEETSRPNTPGVADTKRIQTRLRSSQRVAGCSTKDQAVTTRSRSQSGSSTGSGAGADAVWSGVKTRSRSNTPTMPGDSSSQSAVGCDTKDPAVTTRSRSQSGSSTESGAGADVVWSGVKTRSRSNTPTMPGDSSKLATVVESMVSNSVQGGGGGNKQQQQHVLQGCTIQPVSVATYVPGIEKEIGKDYIIQYSNGKKYLATWTGKYFSVKHETGYFDIEKVQTRLRSSQSAVGRSTKDLAVNTRSRSPSGSSASDAGADAVRSGVKTRSRSNTPTMTGDSSQLDQQILTPKVRVQRLSQEEIVYHTSPSSSNKSQGRETDRLSQSDSSRNCSPAHRPLATESQSSKTNSLAAQSGGVMKSSPAHPSWTIQSGGSRHNSPAHVTSSQRASQRPGCSQRSRSRRAIKVDKTQRSLTEFFTRSPSTSFRSPVQTRAKAKSGNVQGDKCKTVERSDAPPAKIVPSVVDLTGESTDRKRSAEKEPAHGSSTKKKCVEVRAEKLSALGQSAKCMCRLTRSSRGSPTCKCLQLGDSSQSASADSKSSKGVTQAQNVDSSLDSKVELKIDTKVDTKVHSKVETKVDSKVESTVVDSKKPSLQKKGPELGGKRLQSTSSAPATTQVSPDVKITGVVPAVTGVHQVAPTAAKRKLAIADDDDEPAVVKRRKRNEPSDLEWVPVSYMTPVNQSLPRPGPGQVTARPSFALSHNATAVIESCTEEGLHFEAINTTMCLISSNRYPQPRTLNMLFGILLETDDAVLAQKAYSSLCRILHQHPPSTLALQHTYLQALRKQGRLEGEIGEEWELVKQVISQLSAEVSDLTQTGPFLLLKFLALLFERDFQMLMTRVLQQDSGKKTSVRPCLWSQVVWPVGQHGKINANVQYVTQSFLEAVTAGQVALVTVYQSLVSVTAECCRLDFHTVRPEDWQVSLEQLPQKAVVMAKDLAYRISGEVEEVSDLRLALSTLQLPWLMVHVCHTLLDIYDDILLPLYVQEDLRLCLSTIVTKYLYLIPPLEGRAAKSPHVKSTPVKCANPSKVEITKDKNKNLVAKSPVAASRSSSKVNKRNFKGETALHVACIKNNTSKVRDLLQHEDIDINTKDNAGWTPLHEAANRGHTLCMQLLLEYRPKNKITSYFHSGGDAASSRRIQLQACNDVGVTPLHDAVENNELEAARMLLQHGGSKLLEMQTVYGKKPLDFAQSDEMVELLKAPPSVHLGQTPTKRRLHSLDGSQSQSQSQSQSSQDSWTAGGATSLQPPEEAYVEALASDFVSEDACARYVLIVHQLLASYMKVTKLDSARLNGFSIRDKRALKEIQSPNGAISEIVEDDVHVLRELRGHMRGFESHLLRISRGRDMGMSSRQGIWLLHMLAKCV